MDEKQLKQVKEMFASIGKVSALDFQKRAAAKMRALAKACGAATNQAGYAALMTGAYEIERMEATS